MVRLFNAFPFSWRSIIAASLVATTLSTAAKKSGGLQRFELFIFDSLVRLQGEQGKDPRLVIVGITEADIQTYGWPLSDREIATLLRKIQDHSPKAIGLNIYRATHHSPGRAELEAQFAADNLIAITNVGSSSQVEGVPPPATVPWGRIGFDDISIDPDGIVRRGLLFVDHPEKPYYSFALRMVLAGLPEHTAQFSYDSKALYINNRPVWALHKHAGGYQVIDDSGFQTLLRYRSPNSPAEQISVSQILNDNFEPTQIQNKIVLIGSAAPSLKDDFYTPYSANPEHELTMSGVVIQAQIISQLLDIATNGAKAQYRFLPAWGDFLWLLLWTNTAAILAWKLYRPGLILLVAMASSGAILAIGWMSISLSVWLPIFETLVSIFIAKGITVTQQSLYRTTHDQLTGLPGREVFLLRIKQALGANESTPVIVAFLDLDRFQIINKSLGHYVGDRVLVEISKRLRRTLGQYINIARVGGDEFAILFQNLNLETVKSCLDTMRSELANPLVMENHRLSLNASIGIAITQIKKNQLPEDVLRDAHTAMYRAKALNAAQYQIFSDSMRVEAMTRLDLESNLISALEKQEFLLLYQPIFDLKTNKIYGFEALIRWQDQSKARCVFPSEFIHILEENGMIVPVGEWVIETAPQQIRRWQNQFPGTPLRMNVNLSRRQLGQPDLCRKI